MAGKYKVLIEDKWCKACGICIEFCPKDVLGAKIDGKAEVINEEECIGCKMCEIRCPDFAITVKEVE